MTTTPPKPEDVVRAKGILVEMTEKSPILLYMGIYTTSEANAAIKTLLASHAAQAERIASLEAAASALADLYDTDEGCRSLPQYVVLRDLLSGKDSA